MYIFYHMYCVNDYATRLQATFRKIVNTKLFDEVTNIFVNVGGNVSNEALNLPELQHSKVVLTKEADYFLGETDTLKKLWSFCQTLEQNKPILYLHSKGVSQPTNANVQSWIDYLEYFVIERWQDCLNVLNVYDTCGVNLQRPPSLHYAGNFWWANSNYIKSLPIIDNTNGSSIDYCLGKPRSYPEFWLLHNNFNKPYCFHNSNIDHYSYPYDKTNYAL